MSTIWLGDKRRITEAIQFVANTDFTFGGKQVVKGSIVKQFETENLNWTSWQDPKGEFFLARE